MGKFIHGLKEEIQNEIRILNLYTLEQFMDLTLRLNEHNWVARVKRADPTSVRPLQVWIEIGPLMQVNHKDPFLPLKPRWDLKRL